MQAIECGTSFLIRGKFAGLETAVMTNTQNGTLNPDMLMARAWLKVAASGHSTGKICAQKEDHQASSSREGLIECVIRTATT